MKSRLLGLIVGLVVFGSLLVLRGQEVPPLELTMRGDSLTFRLDSFDRNESWMLQQSHDAESWIDLVPLEMSFGILGFEVVIDRRVLEGRDLKKVFFRARKYFRHGELNEAYLAALAKWNEAGVTSYSYVVRGHQGWSAYEARYTVVDGEVTEVETISAPVFGSVPDGITIEDWFATVESAIENNSFNIDVDWDPELGYPERGYIDFSEMIADEERGWTISELTPLQ